MMFEAVYIPLPLLTAEYVTLTVLRTWAAIWERATPVGHTGMARAEGLTSMNLAGPARSSDRHVRRALNTLQEHRWLVIEDDGTYVLYLRRV